MDKYIGKRLGGRYEIIDVVGVGGMAIVYRARDVVLGRYVAVKILKEQYAKDPDIRKRFSIESQAVAKLSHHNIVSVYDVGNENGTDYIVMELIEGITLKEYLQKKGHLSWQESLFFAQQICRALVHAHSRGIIHQDIKPQNVIILRDGTAKLTDFGIASFATTQETRVVQEAIGSVHYISPEQAKGSKIDYRTDIYSLGVVMYEMLTGRLPFEGETALQVVMQHLKAVPLVPSELQAGIPKGMDEIVMHAMCAAINLRYSSAEELFSDLEQLKNNPAARFGYRGAEDSTGETQVIGRDVQRAARTTPVSPARDRSVSQNKREPAPEPVPDSFFDRLAERPGLAAGIAVAVFALIAAIVAGLLIFTGGGQNEKISVPSLVGRTIDEVMADPTYTEQFTIKEADERQESDRPAGEILEQDPVPGSKVTKGTIITLTVSAGGDNVSDAYKVIDFKGRTLEYAQTILDEHGVSYKTEEEYSEDVEAGKITRTDPEAGQELAKDATLTIYISKGKEDKETDMPSLYGKTQSQAKQALEEVGLVLGSVTSVESSEPFGTVIWQSVEQGTKVKQGTTVNVQLSKGQSSKPDDTTPDTGGDEPDDTTPDTGGGETTEPATGTANIPVALPSDTNQAHVTIAIDGEIVFEKMYDTASAGSTVTVPLRATAGEHSVTITVDGAPTTSTYTFS